jgi:hypothetical protein
MSKIFSLIFTCSLFIYTILPAQNNRPLVQKEPAWVTNTSYDYSDTRLDDQADDGSINLVLEKQVSLQQQSIYTKTAIKIISETGVQNSSEVRVNFDPSYSQLIFHAIKIIRGGSSLNKLQPAKIKVIQQEDELNRFLYNGSLSAVLFLEDVRKGDIIEYSYTIKGFNPVFKGKYSGIFEAAFSVPMYNLYYKLVVPEGRTVQIKNSLTNVACQMSKGAHETSYEWKIRDVPVVHEQDYTPSWYDPYAMIMVSEFSSWKEVNDWAAELFPFNIKQSAALQAKIKEIQSAYTSPEQRILAALRFVQDDVRYMGIEMGENSHRPNSPNKILAQRFGDCKDKSYLLCTLLKAMGVEANPVMINTTFKRSIMQWLPGADAFDHVTVRVLYNNHYYFFDPTISYQRGGIDAIAYPNYHCGLVISDTTTGLTAIPLQNKGLVNVRETFDIPDMSGNAQLLVHSEFTGSFADDMREQFNSNSKAEIKKSFRDFYARYYEKMEADSVSYTDDSVTGKFTTNEYYSIQNFWTLEKGVKKSYFSPYIINSIFRKPKDTKRTMPFGIVYPARYQEEIIVNVPEDWGADESMEDIKCPAFKLRAQYAYFYRKFKLKYEYESLKDHVQPNEAEEYFASFKKVDENLEYSLSKDTDEKQVKELNAEAKSNRSSVNVTYVVCLVVLLFGGGIWFTQRRR